jgi:hypothetical protein
MPHLKCVGCKSRLYRAGTPADLNGDLCPGCGSPLEPVGELAEIVGFRSVTSRDSAADGDAAGEHQRHPECIGDLTARRVARRAMLAQDRLDALRWLDDGGSFRAEAVAIPRPETNS